MAKEKKKEPKISKENEGIFKRLFDNSKAITSNIFGASYEAELENKIDIDNTKIAVTTATDRYKKVNGSNALEFIIQAGETTESVNKRTGKKVPINSLIEDPNNNYVNEMFLSEKERINLYDDYQQIHDYIPQLSKAVQVLVDNILSPDDFTKDVFNIFYNNKDVESIKDTGETEIKDKILHLNNLYKIDIKAAKWIRDTIIMGDKFVAVIPATEGFRQLSVGTFSEDAVTLLSESSVLLSEDEKKMFESELKNTKDFDIKKANIRKDLSELINKAFTVSTDINHLLEKEKKISVDFASEVKEFNAYGKYKTSNTISMPEDKIKSGKAIGGQQKVIRDADSLINAGTDNNTVVDQMDKDLEVHGSFLRELDPRRTVKIQVGSTCYGYYYFEDLGGRKNVLSTNNSFNSFQIKVQTDITSSATQGLNDADAKTRMIVDVFAKNLGKKLNKKFLGENPEFKNIVYDLLLRKNLMDSQTRIIYLAPHHVQHFRIDEKENGYGISKFYPILFTAKIYLSVLTTTLMMKISRSHDKRTFYIDVGESNEIEEVVQGFIRDIKSSDIKLSDLDSIDTIFRSVGIFQDYFIPIIDGERSIEIDTTPGQNAEIENDFLDYLRKTLISGMGVPASMLSYADEMEFARSVSMTNGMFLRQIIGMQRVFGQQFSDMYRKLYANEYEQVNASKDPDEYMMDYDKLEVKFPPPGTLNMTNLTDQVNNAQGLIDGLVNIVAGQNASDFDRNYLMYNIALDLLPNVELKRYKDMLQDAKMAKVEETLKGNIEEEA